MSQPPSACVIGGAGFLGSHVADQLTKTGFEVTIFDRVQSKWLGPAQRMVVGDITSVEQVLDATRNQDVVYNFAAIADLNAARDQPLRAAAVNVVGAVNVLEACRTNGIKRFMYASTVYVYSREGGFYRCSKQSAEHFVEEYHQTFGLDYTILRYGSLYGPRSDSSNGLYRIVRNALVNHRLSYDGDPDSVREYIHVEDAAEASVAALGEEFRCQSLVFTGHDPMRVEDLLKMLGEMLNLPHQPNFGDTQMPGHYVRTPYAYQPKLGRKYTPQLRVDLGQGLLQLINEVQAQL